MTIAAGFDIETTGLEWLEGHRIIEVAILFYQVEERKQIGKFVQRINPERPIAADAQRVHGISFDQLTSMPKWAEVAPKVSVVLNRADFIVAHNGEGFDMPFVNHELARVGQTTVNRPLVDTMKQARWATPLGKTPNLGELCFACSVDYDKSKAHAAEYDVEVMMECFFKEYANGFFSVPLVRDERKAA